KLRIKLAVQLQRAELLVTKNDLRLSGGRNEEPSDGDGECGPPHLSSSQKNVPLFGTVIPTQERTRGNVPTCRRAVKRAVARPQRSAPRRDENRRVEPGPFLPLVEHQRRIARLQPLAGKGARACAVRRHAAALLQDALACLADTQLAADE